MTQDNTFGVKLPSDVVKVIHRILKNDDFMALIPYGEDLEILCKCSFDKNYADQGIRTLLVELLNAILDSLEKKKGNSNLRIEDRSYLFLELNHAIKQAERDLNSGKIKFPDETDV